MDSDDEQADECLGIMQARVHQNQPYDESLEVPDAEEIASTYSPTPRAPVPREKAKAALSVPQKGEGAPGGGMEEEGGGGGFSPQGSDGDAGLSDNTEDGYEDSALTMTEKGQPQPAQRGGVQPLPQGKPQGQQFNTDEDEDDSEDDDDDDDDDEDDDDDDHPQVEGAYDPADYENLSVSAEIKELFQYITRYTPQSIELDHKLKPFIPDYIPAVGDIDAFIKIARPDSKPDTLGLTVLDEPCAKQSDPTVLDLQLRAISKQTTAKQLVVKSLTNAEKNPKHIENWIENIRELHRSKPPPNVHYSKNMPEIDTLMQEWPPEFEQLLKEVGLPTAELDCDLGEYVEIICAMLDIPIYKNSAQHNEKIQALHVLFTLYSEFKNSQHFRALAEENKLDNDLKDIDGADRFVL
ncbi:intraflagellar transport protein 46 homolog [Aplysia californica]|uniref:Intraflagellar transport protein 46 homolog n=1 Tax=Aplysia californica TaxID=6500 RepID=A0ABM1A269_APLCA|nr:intraflagellar transport protein 46 homolog [Aplysia californica]